MGVILYEFLVGCVPFFGNSPEELFSQVINGKYPPIRIVYICGGLSVALRTILSCVTDDFMLRYGRFCVKSRTIYSHITHDFVSCYGDFESRHGRFCVTLRTISSHVMDNFVSRHGRF